MLARNVAILLKENKCVEESEYASKISEGAMKKKIMRHIISEKIDQTNIPI